MEKINIAELLKDCPKGMELDCTIFEGIEFDGIVDNKYTPIRCRIKNPDGGYNVYFFTKHGCWIDDCKAKCVIFPKGKTTWEGFVPPCQFKDCDVLFIDCSDGEDKSYQYIFILNKPEFYGKWHSYCHLDGVGDFHSIATYLAYDEDHPRFATEEEKAKLFKVIKDNGYKWNSETKTLEKLIEPKFKVGDRIRHKCPEFRGERIVNIRCDTGYFTTINDWIDIAHQDDWELIPNESKNSIEFEFNNGDVIVCENHWGPFISIFKENVTERNGFIGYCVLDVDDNEFKVKDSASYFNKARFATKREKEQLFRAIERNGYKWNEKTKTLEKVEPKFRVGDRIQWYGTHVNRPIRVIKSLETDRYRLDNGSYVKFGDEHAYKLLKFDVNVLKPFESKVLVRNDESQYWIPAFWGCKRADGYATTFGWCKYCIPFEGNEHLLETNKDCDEHFKTWK